MHIYSFSTEWNLWKEDEMKCFHHQKPTRLFLIICRVLSGSCWSSWEKELFWAPTRGRAVSFPSYFRIQQESTTTLMDSDHFFKYNYQDDLSRNMYREEGLGSLFHVHLVLFRDQIILLFLPRLSFINGILTPIQFHSTQSLNTLFSYS
jgi:hypothetical protein